jgi:DNA-directed RNA polymerase I, II, and III subunit RPABC1
MNEVDLADSDEHQPLSSATAAANSGTIARGGLTPEASRLFRVYKTVASMLYKRGYLVPRDMREMTPASFAAKFGEFPSRESLTILVVRFMISL